MGASAISYAANTDDVFLAAFTPACIDLSSGETVVYSVDGTVK